MLLATSRSITLETRHSKLSAVDQKGSPKQWRDILTQQCYSTIELECLAIVLAVQKCSICLRGLPSFRILTDHRPLQGISQKYLFDLTSPRLQRMREKIAMYNFIIQWTPGKSHLLADALSRAPLFTPKDLPGLEIDTAILCLFIISHPSLDAIYSAINADYRLLLTDVPNHTRHSTYSHHLKAEFDSLSTSDSLVLLDSRSIVLPLPAVKPIPRLLHASHSGINKTLTLGRGLYYWPGMVHAVKQLVSQCKFCSHLLPSQPFSPMVTQPPSTHLGFSMQHVGLNLFSYGGKQYLICVDHWSGYPLYSLL